MKEKTNRYACRFCACPIRMDRSLCPACKRYNVPNSGIRSGDESQVKPLSQAKRNSNYKYYDVGQWNQVFSRAGGIPYTATILLSGKNGGGKSRWAMQLCDLIAPIRRAEFLREDPNSKRVGALYVGIEALEDEMVMLADSVGVTNTDDIYLYPLDCNEVLADVLERLKPGFLVVDSIKALCPSDDSGTDFLRSIKESYASKFRMPTVVINHIVKDGDPAGPEQWQHWVDTTMLIMPVEKNAGDTWRTIMVNKNRFGPSAPHFAEMVEPGILEYRRPTEDEDDEP